jgi:hypothetical protein
MRGVNGTLTTALMAGYGGRTTTPDRREGQASQFLLTLPDLIQGSMGTAAGWIGDHFNDGASSTRSTRKVRAGRAGHAQYGSASVRPLDSRRYRPLQTPTAIDFSSTEKFSTCCPGNLRTP